MRQGDQATRITPRFWLFGGNTSHQKRGATRIQATQITPRAWLSYMSRDVACEFDLQMLV
jgi:hypothetical protein